MLLYISDERANNVYVFTYPAGKLVGTLSGFNSPQGLCVDIKGDVFVADANDYEVVEFAHGGTEPIKTISQRPLQPEGCAVDPTTGNLAVTGNRSECGHGVCSGRVAIYTHAVGKPKRYKIDHFFTFFFAAYDDSGNLYVDGTDGRSEPLFEFGELPQGSQKFVNISLNQSVEYPGGLKWDGRYIAIGDSKGGNVYQFTIQGRKALRKGITRLSNSNFVFGFWIQGSKLIGPNAGTTRVDFWRYPKGGSPIRTLSGFSEPFGAVVSSAH